MHDMLVNSYFTAVVKLFHYQFLQKFNQNGVSLHITIRTILQDDKQSTKIEWIERLFWLQNDTSYILNFMSSKKNAHKNASY